MNYNAITTIIVHVLSIVHCQQREVLLISELNSFFRFDHNVFILAPIADADRFINTNGRMECTPQTVYIFDTDDAGNITGLESLTNIWSKDALVVVVPDSTKMEKLKKLIVPVIQQLDKSTKELLHINMKIGVFFTQVVGEKELKTLFEWCWERGINNIFAATYPADQSIAEHSLNIFTFNPFGAFQVTNVTGSESFQNIFLNENRNFQQHPVRLSASFKRLSDRMLWETIFRSINASVVHVGSKNIVDILSEPYYMDHNYRGFMYPMKMESEVLVVPQSLPYSGFTAYLQSLTSDEFFGYFLVTIFAVVVLLSLLRLVKLNKKMIFQSGADVVNLLMNDNAAIKYQQLSRIEVFIIVPLTFVGFVIVNGLLSNLKSYLTRPILQPQIDDIEQIYRSQFPILTLNEIWKDSIIAALEDQSPYRDWGDKIQVLDVKLLGYEISSYNTSIAFLWNLPAIECLRAVQKRLNIRGYHVTKAKIYSQHLTYALSDSFPFMERMNEIASRTKSAGLYKKWLKLEHSEIESEFLEMNKLLRIDSEPDVEPFSIPIFIVYGWIAGSVVFIVEIIWEKCKFWLTKRI